MLPLLLLLLVQSVSTRAHSTAASASASSSSTANDETERAPKHKHHHNCIHEEKVDEFDATVDPRSLVSPQRLYSTTGSPLAGDAAAPSPSSQHSWILESFFDTVGLSSTTVKRALRSSATEAASAFQPIRIAFDLSKLTRCATCIA